MNLKHLTNETLLKDLKYFVSEERRILNLTLRYLKEVEYRRLHLQMGYPNLYAFCTKELGYSEASSHRRISTMRLIKEIPEVEEKLLLGELNLSVISKAQSHFKKEQTTLSEKRNILKKLENKTIKESERFLLGLSPLSIPEEKQIAVSETHTEMRFTLSKEALEKLEQVKAKHSHKNLTTAQIFEMGLELLLKNNAPLPSQRSENHSSNKRYIPKPMKHFIAERDNSSCQYQDPITNRKCNSKYYLQYDHIKPLSYGGKTETTNLRLLCSNHNKLAWQEL